VRVARVVNDTHVELKRPLRFDHLGDGWSDAGINTHAGRGWSSDGDQIPEYSAEVGLLSHNVIIQGDHPTSRREQFGVQVVWCIPAVETVTSVVADCKFGFDFDCNF